jgi:hypothetical protein
MTTSRKDASLASRQLKSKKSTAAQTSVAGSDLPQAKKEPTDKKNRYDAQQALTQITCRQSVVKCRLSMLAKAFLERGRS